MPGRRWRLFALDSAPRYGRSGTFKALFRALRGSPPRRAQQVLSNSPACAQSSESSHSRAPPKRPSLGLRIPARSTTLTRRSAAEVRARRRARSYQPSARPRVTEPRLNRCAQVRGHFRSTACSGGNVQTCASRHGRVGDAVGGARARAQLYSKLNRLIPGARHLL